MTEGLIAALGSLIVALLLDVRADVKALVKEHGALKAWAQHHGFVAEKWT